MKHSQNSGQSSRFPIWPLLLAVVVPPVGALVWLASSTSSPGVAKRGTVEDFSTQLAIFDTVFWEPRDTESLRAFLREHPEFVASKSVLEIGTGSGLLALCCCQHGAARVVATDVNPHAIACARHNADRLGFSPEIRYVERKPDAPIPTAFDGIDNSERFDVILSNPPWEDGKPKQWSDYALYDPDFRLLRSILRDARSHLSPGGKILLAYGCVEAIHCVHQLAQEYHYDVVVLDDRELESLPPVFLPGMLLGLTPQPATISPNSP